MMNSASALRRRTPNPNSPFEGFEGATQPYDTAQTHAGSTFFPSFRLSNQYSAHSKSSHLNSRLLTPSRQDKAPHNHGRIDSTVPRIASSIPGPLGKTGESSQTPVNPYRDVGPVVSNTKDEAKVLDRFSSWSSSTTLVSRALSTFGSWFKRKSSSTPSPDRKYPRNLPEVKADIGIEATSLPEYFGEQLEKIEEGMEPCMSNVTAQGDGLAESWTAFKWILLMSTITVLAYGAAGLAWACCLLVKLQSRAEVILVSDPDLVIYLTLASILCILSAAIGIAGTVMESRPVLAFYNLFLWPTLFSITIMGYVSYKRLDLNLDGKLNESWSRSLGPEGRKEIQDALQCCGYYSSLHEATYSDQCYPRSLLPGCKGVWSQFEARSLSKFASASFGTVPLHLVNIIVALLCSNHINRTFGRGLTPLRYRLRAALLQVQRQPSSSIRNAKAEPALD